MQAQVIGVVMAGGKGTRLEPLKLGIPKALAPINGIPFIKLLVEWLLRHLPQVAVVCGPQDSDFVSVFDDNMRVRVIAGIQGGTGADLCIASRLLKGDALVVCNADTIVDLNLGDLVSQYFASRRTSTIVLTRRTDVPIAPASKYCHAA